MTRMWPEPTRVLLVEDERLTQNLLKARFEMEGLEVRTAWNGQEALATLEREPVDMVVTDLMMPTMNGFRLIQEIRELESAPRRVPILVISNLQNEQEIVSCFAAGADDFMTKPIQIPLLMERLWRLLQRAQPGE
jgi:DNA-binding response OmpR family regulator